VIDLKLKKGGRKCEKGKNGVCDKEDKGRILRKEVDCPTHFRRPPLCDDYISYAFLWTL
jgi:hypothetical protein